MFNVILQAQNSFGGFAQAAAVPNIAQLATLVAANGGAGERFCVDSLVTISP